MSLDPANFPPAQAWAPLKDDDWSLENARHLLHRIGFSATPDRVQLAYTQGLQDTLHQAFGIVRPFAEPESLGTLRQKRAELVAQQQADNAAQAAATREGKAAAPASTALSPQRQLNMEINQLERQAFLDYVQAWLAFSAKPENSAQENLVMFLGNVLVVGQSKVRDPQRLYAHANLLRTMFQKPYPDICKAVTYSPAMIQYLDLNTSTVGVPNENYARELMELFTLGEGNYTENDVKEAARALSGIIVRQQPLPEYGAFARQRWDAKSKTIFGQTGNWGAENVVDLIFQQPASRTHLPRRFLAYFLSQEPLSAPYMEELGHQWRNAGWRVESLASIVFSSNLFYRPEFRLALVKTPIQYYLGLCQDLGLDVTPLEGQAFQNLRAMGQEPFNPPNVRGWLGGKNWINSSTLAARRQLVQQMFNPNVNLRALTADQQIKLKAARAAGHGAITVDNTRLQNLADKSDDELTDALLNFFLAGEVTTDYRNAILDYLQNDQGARLELVREVAVALFQSPEYHLC